MPLLLRLRTDAQTLWKTACSMNDRMVRLTNWGSMWNKSFQNKHAKMSKKKMLFEFSTCSTTVESESHCTSEISLSRSRRRSQTLRIWPLGFRVSPHRRVTCATGVKMVARLIIACESSSIFFCATMPIWRSPLSSLLPRKSRSIWTFFKPKRNFRTYVNVWLHR